MTLTWYAEQYGHAKYDWYFPFFDSILSEFRDKKFRLLEIGVSEGSLMAWLDCFRNAEIVGLDHSMRDSSGNSLIELGAQHSRLTFILGEQEDDELLTDLGSFDVVIDDGGHLMHQQIGSFETLFPLMNAGGWYFIEDLHTSYMDGYLTGVEEGGTTIDFLKMLIDDFHARHHGDGIQTWPVSEIRFIDSVVAIRKRDDGI